MLSRPRHTNRLLAFACAACTVLAALALAEAAAPALASPTQLSVMMDDNLLVYGAPQQRNAALRLMRAYGVDAVRVTVLWSVAADGATSGANASRFRGDHPSTYPVANWDRYDGLVESARANHIGVIFNVTGPGPAWSHEPLPTSRPGPIVTTGAGKRVTRHVRPAFPPLMYSRVADAWKPRPSLFAKFVAALGKRYSGHYHDENDAHALLPRVSVWSIWNEPNQPLTLAPQSDYSPRLKKVIPVAPTLYRELYWAATDALRRTGHDHDSILMGETAPLGSPLHTPRAQLHPKEFIRELFCVGRDGRPYSGAEAAARGCDRVAAHGPFLVGGWAHHPYTQKNPPWRRDGSPDSINMANVGDLGPFLDGLADRTGLIARGLPVLLTEIGYQTLPPDPIDGITLAKQAEYLNVADEIAYRAPRVVAQTQFMWRDAAPEARYPVNSKGYWRTWQSGLEFANGALKPAALAYLMPFDAHVSARADGGAFLDVWGRVRFLPHGTGGTVVLQFRPAGSSVWQSDPHPVAVSSQFGFYETARFASQPGRWRAVWSGKGPYQRVASREVTVGF